MNCAPLVRIARTLCASVVLCASAGAAHAQAATARVVRAAHAFLATLDSAQRTRVLFAFDDPQQRARWSNFPTGFVPRAGVSLRELTAAQRTAALALVSSALSRRGYEKVQQIMEADEVFKETDRGRGPRGGGPPAGPPSGPPRSGPPGGQAMFGRDLYYLSILGTPAERTPWMLQYGGHHLALNITVAGERGVLTPTLTGAQPALYARNGKTVRPIGPESDKGLALLNALDASQRAQAVLNYRVAP